MAERRPGLYERAARSGLTCGSCLSAIDKGDKIIRDLTRRAHHVACRRRGIRPHVDLTDPVRRHVSPFDGIGEPVEAPTCPGCGRPVLGEHWVDSVTAFGTRWHGDCRRREARGGRLA